MFTIQTSTKGKIEVTMFFPDIPDQAKWPDFEKSMPEELRVDIAKRIDRGFPVSKKKLNVTMVGKSWDETLAMLLGVVPGEGDGDKEIEDTRKRLERVPMKISVYLFEKPIPLGRFSSFRTSSMRDPFHWLGGRDPFGPFGYGGAGPFGSFGALSLALDVLFSLTEHMEEFMSSARENPEHPLEAFVLKHGKDAKCGCGDASCVLQTAIDAEKRRQKLI